MGGRTLKRFLRKRILVATAYVAAAIALAWTTWLAGVEGLAQQAHDLRWRFVLFAIAADVAAYVCQAMRWRLLLGTVGDLPLLRAAQAVYVGLFASEVLPMRPGDGIRAWLAARTLNTPVSAVVPSIIVERFFDGLLLSAAVGIVSLSMPLPSGFAAGARILGGAILLFAAVLGYAAAHARDNVRGESGNSSAARPAWIRTIAGEIASGIRAIGIARNTIVAFVLSMLLMIGQIAAFWLAMRAAAIDRSFLIAAAVLTLVRLGTVVPNAPANAGTFQVFTILGLTMFGVDRASAAAFSIVAFLILTIPLWLIGGVALAGAGTSLVALRASASGGVERGEMHDRGGVVASAHPVTVLPRGFDVNSSARTGTGVAPSVGRGVR